MLLMKYRKRIYYTEANKTLMRDRWQKGDTLHEIARPFDRHHSSVRGILERTGAIRQRQRGWDRFRRRRCYRGGGGFGDPSRRPRQRVLADVRDGNISEESAAEIYGYDPRSPPRPPNDSMTSIGDKIVH
jgi:hypothetical protein